MKNTLKLKRMGGDFRHGEEAQSDVGNYRVRTDGECVKGKDGRMYFIEFTLWRDRKQARYNHKITGKPLMHIAYDIINPQGLAIDTQYTDETGLSYRNADIEKAITKSNYSYKKADMLKAVNRISFDKYDEIEII